MKINKMKNLFGIISVLLFFAACEKSESYPPKIKKELLSQEITDANWTVRSSDLEKELLVIMEEANTGDYSTASLKITQNSERDQYKFELDVDGAKDE
jgi:hypothetical protein